ncbi:MAG: carbon-nitrogen hydrolase family protein [bacterium]
MLAAAIQMDSKEDITANWATAKRLAEEAKGRGAQLVAFSETFLYVGPDKTAASDLDGEWLPKFSALAAELGVYLLAGSVGERIPDSKKIYNTSVLLDPRGKELARYRKIHLFDATFPNGRSYRESDYIAPGAEVVIAKTEFCDAGLSICYDLRFPELYRRLVAGGETRLIFVPSNFTLMTGKDHWLPLLQARAIENQVYLIAPNQCGEKYGGRASCGRSAIIDPWGTVLGLAPPDREGVVLAEIDFDYQDEVRRALPCLNHIRLHTSQ